MTNYERINQLSVENLAVLLCDMQDECEYCPANYCCSKGHNGMKEWLEMECDVDE